MKKKTVLLIGSIAAVGLLAGGTFAAYTITDNANPFGIKISPTEIVEDRVGTRTLSWGQKAVNKIEDLAAGATVKAGTIGLKAEGTDGNASVEETVSYTGVLDLELTDLTSYAPAYAGEKLIDHLTVSIYTGNLESPDNEKLVGKVGLVSTDPRTVNLSDALTAVGNNETNGKIYSVFVTLENVLPVVYNTIANHVVYMTFDWNRAAADEQSAKEVFLYDAGGVLGATPKIYAWGTGTVNGDWPGQPMEKVSEKYFRYGLTAGYQNFIFANDDGTVQTVNITRDDTKPYYTLGSVVAEGDDAGHYNVNSSATKPEISAFDYYVVGAFSGAAWNATFVEARGMVSDGENNVAKIEHLALAAGDEIKVARYNSTGAARPEDYYGADGEDGTNWTRTNDGNIKIAAGKGGNYTIYLNNSYNIWAIKE